METQLQQAMPAQCMPAAIPAAFHAPQSTAGSFSYGSTSAPRAFTGSVASHHDAPGNETEERRGNVTIPTAPQSSGNDKAPALSGNEPPFPISNQATPATSANLDDTSFSSRTAEIQATDPSGQTPPNSLSPEIPGLLAAAQPNALPQNSSAGIPPPDALQSTSSEPGHKSAHNAQAIANPATPSQSAKASPTRSQESAAEKSTSSASLHIDANSAPPSSHAAAATEGAIPATPISAAPHTVNGEPQDRSGPADRPSAAAAATDTFSALDAGTPSATWLHAGARHAEAGYLDPALGWVGVRAETAGGTLHASILPGSAQAAQTLSGHLSGLSTYLAEHHGDSAYVTMASPNGSQAGTGFNQDHSANAQHQQQRHTSRDDIPSSTVEPITSSQESPPQSRWDIAAAPRRAGAHISVVA